MAGDWLKIELELPDKPEVHAIAAMLDLDPDAVVGKLIRMWQWFDKHTVDGNAIGVSVLLPDRLARVSGFGQAMVSVGWLEQNENMLTMPRFDRHTSESAKKRAETAKRVAKHKQKTNAKGNANSVSDVLPDALPKEEKNKNITNTNILVKRASKLPDDFAPNTGHLQMAAERKLDLRDEMEKFRDYHTAKGNTMKDWNAALRTWLRNAATYRKTSPPKSYMDKMQEMSNRLTGRNHDNDGITIDLDQRAIRQV